MQRVKWAVVALVLVAGVTVLAQRNAFNTRLRTDANGYLVTSNLAYTGPDGPLTAFPNLRLKVDANNYLLTTMNGAQTVSVSGQATTSTDGMVLQNTTAATGGATVQISPRLSWIGTAWDTAASETVAFFSEVLPATAATPTGTWKLGYSLNGAAATYPFTVTSAGIVSGAGFTATGSDTLGACGSTNEFRWSSGTLIGCAANGSVSVTTQARTSGLQDTFGADVTVGTCGSGAPVAGSKNGAGNVVATGATACTVIFGSPTFTNKPFCIAQPESGSIPTLVVNTTVSFTVTGITSGATFNYLCRGRI